jgi:hypothetical protein
MRNLAILVDECDRHFLKAYRWHLQGGANRPRRRQYVATTAPGKRTIYLHRVILDLGPGEFGDHINGDPLDNRRANLRRVTHRENTQNRPNANRNNTSGARGVTMRKDRGAWRAQANFRNPDGTRGHVVIGQFATVEEASRAIDAWRRSHMPGYVPNECGA